MVKIDILNHADYCGEFRGDKYIPGLRKFYNAIQSVRSLNPDNTLLLDAGDEINRLLWYGKDVLDGMKLIGTDCWTIGNHEFDKGKDSLQENIDYICNDIEVLCANITQKENGRLIDNVKPYTIIEKSGIKIGIIGVTTEYTEKMVTYPNFEPFKMHSCAEAIHFYSKELREKGAQIIIVLSHIGSYSTDGRHSGELFDLLKDIKDDNIDLLIGGHLNGDIAQQFDNVMVNKGGFSGKSLLHTALFFDEKENRVVRKEAEVIYPLEDKYDQPNEKIDNFVSKVLEPFDLYFNDVLALAKEDVLMDYNKESAQGNLFADAVRYKVKTDFAYFNTTSCGPRIAKGPVTRYSIKQAIYFDETVWISKMTGKEIKQLFEMVHNPEIYSKNFNLYFSGLVVTVDHNREYGHKVVAVKYPDGKEVNDDEILSVCSSEYMASGGNDTREIANNRQWTDSGIYIHEAIKDYLVMKKEIDNSIDCRYIFIGEGNHYDNH